MRLDLRVTSFEMINFYETNESRCDFIAGSILVDDFAA